MLLFEIYQNDLGVNRQWCYFDSYYRVVLLGNRIFMVRLVSTNVSFITQDYYGCKYDNIAKEIQVFITDFDITKPKKANAVQNIIGYLL